MNTILPKLITMAIVLILLWTWVGIEKLLESRELKQLKRELSKHRERRL